MRRPDRYYVYILTNQHRTALYTGITSDMERRQAQHQTDAVFFGKGFAGRYQAFYVVYYEVFPTAAAAIARETQLKGWRRSKKVALIEGMNPEWRFLNEELGW